MLRAAFISVGMTLAIPAGDALAASSTVTVRDPGARGAWVGRLEAGGGGRSCVRVYRRSSKVGTRFCGVLSGNSVYVYGRFHRRTRDPQRWRTALIVGFDPAVVRARLAVPGRTVRYRRGHGPRLMLVVLRGFVERGELEIDVRRGGRTTTMVVERRRGVRTDDPGGGAGWRVVPDLARRGQAGCLRWERIPPRFADLPAPKAGASRCWPAHRTTVVAQADVVAGQDRTVITGLAADNVRAVRTRTPSGERPVAIDEQTGALLAVLPGQVPPEQIELVVTLDDGSEVVLPVDGSG